MYSFGVGVGGEQGCDWPSSRGAGSGWGALRVPCPPRRVSLSERLQREEQQEAEEEEQQLEQEEEKEPPEEEEEGEEERIAKFEAASETEARAAARLVLPLDDVSHRNVFICFSQSEAHSSLVKVREMMLSHISISRCNRVMRTMSRERRDAFILLCCIAVGLRVQTCQVALSLNM